MPEMVALFNGFGGIASLLLAWGEYHQHPELSVFIALVTFLSAFIGGITFSGCMVAFGKLAEMMPSKAIVFSGQHIVNGAILLAALVSGVIFAMNPAEQLCNLPGDCSGVASLRCHLGHSHRRR